MSVQCKYNVNFKVAAAAASIVFLIDSVTLGQVPDATRQLLVATATDWNSQRATMQAFQRDGKNSSWRPAFRADWPVQLGRNGLAWGRGVFSPPDDKLPRKTEKDGRAPAGIFALGLLLGYAPAAPQGTLWPYTRVGPYDAWIDDPRLPRYNEHVRVEPGQIPEWFESQKMRLGDKAYKWLLEIRHNTDPPRPGSGSAIFFHVQRGPDRPSAGCTTMALEDLERVIAWLRPEAQPHFILLPRAVYNQLQAEWRLP